MSVKISVFWGYFWRSLLYIYYANEFSFLPLFILFRSFYCFVLFAFLIPLLCRFVYGLNTDTLVIVPR